MDMRLVFTPCVQELQKCNIGHRDIIYWMYITVIWFEGVRNSKVLKKRNIF